MAACHIHLGSYACLFGTLSLWIVGKWHQCTLASCPQGCNSFSHSHSPITIIMPQPLVLIGGHVRMTAVTAFWLPTPGRELKTNKPAVNGVCLCLMWSPHNLSFPQVYPSSGGAPNDCTESEEGKYVITWISTSALANRRSFLKLMAIYLQIISEDTFTPSILKDQCPF